MLKIIALFTFSLLISSVIHSQSALPSDNLKLGYVDDRGLDCGCSVSLNLTDIRNHRYILNSPLDGGAYIQLNGEKLKLRLIAESKEKAEERVGDRSWKTYSSGNLNVKIDYVVTGVCDPNDEQCEVTNYRARMIVIRGKQRRVVKGIALCGC